jgi:hypothetical protein
MRSYVALVVVALAVVGVVVVACGETGQSCQPGTLALTIQLYGTAAFADTITISSKDPELSVSVPHNPMLPPLLVVDVAFPGGYPANKLVVFTVRATGGITPLGENSANIHLPPGCSTGYVSVSGSSLQDASVAD